MTNQKWIHFSRNFTSKMESRNRVISTAHLTACSIKKHVKAPDLTWMPLYGNVLSNIKIAWTAKQHWVLTKHRGPSLHTMTSPLLYYKREKQRIRVGLTYNATTGRPPSKLDWVTHRRLIAACLVSIFSSNRRGQIFISQNSA